MNLHTLTPANGLPELLSAYLHRHNPSYRFWWNADTAAVQYVHRSEVNARAITVTPTDLAFFQNEATHWHSRGRP